MPAWPCTIGFGSPVVPDENRIQSGWSGATCSNAERFRRRVVGSGELLPEQRTRAQRSPVLRVEVRYQHDVLERRQSGSDALHLRATRKRLAAVAVAVDAEHELRRELRETVEHAARAEVRAAPRPDRADAGRREHRDDGIRRVRQAADHPVALDDPESSQRRRHSPDARGQLIPRQAGRRPPFAQVDERLRAGTRVAEHVLRVVEPRAREPFRARHRPPAQRARGRHARAYAEVLPQRAPEPLEVLHRPAPERGVVVEATAPLAVEPAHESRQVRALDARCVGLPEQVTLGYHTPLPAITRRSPASSRGSRSPHAGAASSARAARRPRYTTRRSGRTRCCSRAPGRTCARR